MTDFILSNRFFKALPLAEAGERIYMGQGEIQLFKTIKEVYNFRWVVLSACRGKISSPPYASQ